MSSHIRSRLVELHASVDAAIQFAKLDLGRKPEYSGMAGCHPCAPPAKVYYPRIWLEDRPKPIDLPESGKAVVEYRVTGRSTNERDGVKRHTADIEIRSIDPIEDKPRKATDGVARPVRMGDSLRKDFAGLRPGMIQFSRARDGDGQFAPEAADGGPGPATMKAAYSFPIGGKVAGGAAAGLGGTAAALLLARALKGRGRK